MLVHVHPKAVSKPLEHCKHIQQQLNVNKGLILHLKCLKHTMKLVRLIGIVFYHVLHQLQDLAEFRHHTRQKQSFAPQEISRAGQTVR